MPQTVKDKTSFQADKFIKPEDRNQRLADLLQGTWLDLAIVFIERIEIGSKQGWRATYRE